MSNESTPPFEEKKGGLLRRLFSRRPTPQAPTAKPAQVQEMVPAPPIIENAPIVQRELGPQELVNLIGGNLERIKGGDASPADETGDMIWQLRTVDGYQDFVSLLQRSLNKLSEPSEKPSIMAQDSFGSKTERTLDHDSVPTAFRRFSINGNTLDVKEIICDELNYPDILASNDYFRGSKIARVLENGADAALFGEDEKQNKLVLMIYSNDYLGMKEGSARDVLQRIERFGIEKIQWNQELLDLMKTTVYPHLLSLLAKNGSQVAPELIDWGGVELSGLGVGKFQSASSGLTDSQNFKDAIRPIPRANYVLMGYVGEPYKKTNNRQAERFALRLLADQGFVPSKIEVYVDPKTGVEKVIDLAGSLPITPDAIRSLAVETGKFYGIPQQHIEKALQKNMSGYTKDYIEKLKQTEFYKSHPDLYAEIIEKLPTDNSEEPKS